MCQSKLIYPEEFKRNIVQLYLLTGKSTEQLEQEWGVERGLLSVWKQQFEISSPIENTLADADSDLHVTSIFID